MLVFLTPVAWLVPARSWPTLTRVAAAAYRVIFRGRARRRVDRIEAARAEAARADKRGHSEDGIDRELMAGAIEQHLQVLREYHPAGWSPRLRVVGREHLDDALAAGRGAVLWVAPFTFNSLVVKKALKEARLELFHLSTSGHGYSLTRFGRRWLNPVRTRCEDRYLAERVIMQDGAELAALRRLERLLRQNRLVAIACSAAGRRQVRVTIGRGRLPIATGAASLALSAGAPLLPVFVARRGPDAFDVVVEEPLVAPDRPSRHEAVDGLTRAFGARIDGRLWAAPTSGNVWKLLEIGETPADGH